MRVGECGMSVAEWEMGVIMYRDERVKEKVLGIDFANFGL